jgi:hypothetical protein
METKTTAIDWLAINASIDNELLLKIALKIQRDQLEHAFKAGWMKANATNYNPSYFENYLNNLDHEHNS